jgi:hypothetical protein
MKPDGFNLEQSILECWQVCEDLKYGKMDQQVLAKYYEVKFNQLWEIFEELTHDRYFTSSTRTTPTPDSFNNERSSS